MGIGEWKETLEVIGIVVSLIFAGGSFLFDAKVRRVSNLLEITQQHRSLWKELIERPELGRIIQSDIDLVGHPVTDQERMFAMLLIIHISTTFAASKSGLVLTHQEMRHDVRELMDKPVIVSVWREVRQFQHPKFVQFVECCS